MKNLAADFIGPVSPVSIRVSNGISSTFGSVDVFPSSPSVNNLYKTVTILANQSEILEPGITLGAQDSIVVSGNTNLTYSAYGVELS